KAKAKAKAKRIAAVEKFSYIRKNTSTTKPPSQRCGDPTSQLPQGSAYICKMLVGCQAAIAGKPAPTGIGVY
ncbi:hypothetical protein, partial [Pseudomonas sp. UMAB-40]|uniref:hypothetical protein n=1 Tax=Pseudomonas sp. UMAB-40 TaxID=1365407 RepID=UPI001C5869DE